MRPTRVDGALYTVGPLACPRCGRVESRNLVAYGIVRVTCSGSVCRDSWTAIRVPPGATGQQVAEVYGLDVARAVCGALRPNDDPCSDDAVLLCPIPAAHEPTYLIRMECGRGVNEPPAGWARVARIIGVMMRAS